MAVLLLATFSIPQPPTVRAEEVASSAPKPTIVLVHGAFADASGWSGVVQRLQDRGYTVLAPANPLRTLTGDSAYLTTILASTQGPVVLVGHSYGGAVITNAATAAPNVKALVYIAAFAPDAGETALTLQTMNPGSKLTPDALVLRPYVAGVDAYISPAVFREVFCADVPRATASVMGASQRAIDLAALAQPSGVPAWRLIPSWYMVARQDMAIPAMTERFMARRMGATTVEVASSHVAMVSHPSEVTELVVAAARTIK
jgi:pimeloyl-ACP methyl ester carboxylesterase